MRLSSRVQRFGESVIREMTRLAERHGAINLAQGFPDFGTPPEVVEAATAALRGGHNQYSITWGARSLRQAVAAYYRRFFAIGPDPESEITITCGATEAMLSTLMAVLDPGDEIIIFEPYYENYGPDAILSGAIPKFVRLRPGAAGWEIDWTALEAAFGPRTRAIIVNTPNNPTGKVFTRAELERIAALCIRHDVLCISDEIYNHIVYDGAAHVSPITLPGMRERTVCINALSKTFAVTGWRVGWAVAPPAVTDAIRKVHDFVTVGAPHPLQEAGAACLAMEDAYFAGLAPFYRERRELLMDALAEAGFNAIAPQGAYYVIADFTSIREEDDIAFARRLVTDHGVAAVPGSSFYGLPGAGRRLIRFCFCKSLETLREARRRLMQLVH
jgi:aminotransferase